MKKICVVCGEEFETTKNAEKCCSQECKNIRKKQTDKRKRENKKCKCIECGKEFIGKQGNNFCSKDCRRKHMKENTKEYKHTCIICGKEFIDKNKNSKFCSEKCNYEWVKNNPRYTLICQQCGKEFKSNYKNRKYCSIECAAESKIAPKEIHICKYCGEKFIRKDDGSHDAYKFCSVECTLNYRKHNTHRYCKTCGKELIACQFDYCSEKCKTKDKVKTYVCKCCGKEFEATQEKKYCSEECAYKITRRRKKENFIPEKKICPNCGKEFWTEFKGAKTYCSKKCSKKYVETNAKNKRRIRKYGNGKFSTGITLKKLYKRDKGICKICGKKVDYKDFIKTKEGYFIAGNRYPSIDHIIPLSKGGAHTWDNVQLVHRLCNSIKNDNITSDKN